MVIALDQAAVGLAVVVAAEVGRIDQGGQGGIEDGHETVVARDALPFKSLSNGAPANGKSSVPVSDDVVPATKTCGEAPSDTLIAYTASRSVPPKWVAKRRRCRPRPARRRSRRDWRRCSSVAVGVEGGGVADVGAAVEVEVHVGHARGVHAEVEVGHVEGAGRGRDREQVVVEARVVAVEERPPVEVGVDDQRQARIDLTLDVIGEQVRLRHLEGGAHGNLLGAIDLIGLGDLHPHVALAQRENDLVGTGELDAVGALAPAAGSGGSRRRARRSSRTRGGSAPGCRGADRCRGRRS